MLADILGTSWDQCRSMVQYSFTSTETRRLVRTDSPGRPPRLSHSSWTMKWVNEWMKIYIYTARKNHTFHTKPCVFTAPENLYTTRKKTKQNKNLPHKTLCVHSDRYAHCIHVSPRQDEGSECRNRIRCRYVTTTTTTTTTTRRWKKKWKKKGSEEEAGEDRKRIEYGEGNNGGEDKENETRWWQYWAEQDLPVTAEDSVNGSCWAGRLHTFTRNRNKLNFPPSDLSSNQALCLSVCLSL